ncbi:hypothetical protein MICRO11B_80025 [Micrococcus luteus]|nr:hypothetical protein MICRO11B_80025 [Micrococcus luteus]
MPGPRHAGARRPARRSPRRARPRRPSSLHPWRLLGGGHDAAPTAASVRPSNFWTQKTLRAAPVPRPSAAVPGGAISRRTGPPAGSGVGGRRLQGDLRVHDLTLPLTGDPVHDAVLLVGAVVAQLGGGQDGPVQLVLLLLAQALGLGGAGLGGGRVGLLTLGHGRHGPEVLRGVGALAVGGLEGGQVTGAERGGEARAGLVVGRGRGQRRRRGGRRLRTLRGRGGGRRRRGGRVGVGRVLTAARGEGQQRGSGHAGKTGGTGQGGEGHGGALLE